MDIDLGAMPAALVFYGVHSLQAVFTETMKVRNHMMENPIEMKDTRIVIMSA